MISTRSGRASGSPPVKSACITPSSAASRSTRTHVSVGNSTSLRASSSGFEQYTQCRGQLGVSSAISASGWKERAFIGCISSFEIQRPLLLQQREILEDVLFHFQRVRLRVNLLQVQNNFAYGVLAVAALDDF